MPTHVTIPTVNQHATRLRPVRLLVVHTAESPKLAGSAQAVARYMAGTTGAAAVSAHRLIDPTTVVTQVPLTATAFAAPGANADGVQYELCGRASQSAADWADADSQAILTTAAQTMAADAATLGIPLVHLTDTQLRAGAPGIVGHDQVSRVYGGTHWDPGPAFPWDQLMGLLTGSRPAPTPTVPQEDTMHLIQTTTPWGSVAYALVTETTGATALDAQQAQAYNSLCGRSAVVPWDHYQLLVRQADPRVVGPSGAAGHRPGRHGHPEHRRRR